MIDFEPKQYWEDRLKNFPTALGTGYLGLGKNYNYWLYKIQKKIFFKYVKPTLNNLNNSDVLDIGSGFGFYVDLWRAAGAKSIMATDISEFAVNSLRKSKDIKCQQLDIGGYLPEEFKAKRYDIISAFSVLYHIVDDKRYFKALDNISYLLKPGGFFIFSENFIHKKEVGSKHQISRSLKDIESALEDFGLKVKMRIPVFFFMNNPVDSESVILKVIWLGTSLLVSKCEVLGYALGFMLYQLDFVLLSFLREGPSTEIMICKKI